VSTPWSEDIEHQLEFPEGADPLTRRFLHPVVERGHVLVASPHRPGRLELVPIGPAPRVVDEIDVVRAAVEFQDGAWPVARVLGLSHAWRRGDEGRVSGRLASEATLAEALLLFDAYGKERLRR
jgi:hypothetical protein